MYEFKEVIYQQTLSRDITCLLGADIGGTNSNFGIFQLVNNKPQLLLSLHTKSQLITDFTQVVVQLLTLLHDKYGINVSKSCFAAAGVISVDRDLCKPTNLNFIIDSRDILRHTNLVCAFLANDFEVIGHGLPGLDPKDLVLVNQGTPRYQANKAIIGAGTGLGKAILHYDLHYGRYMPVASEGGHADFAAYDQHELALVEYIKQIKKSESAVSWEDLLSGNGITRMYQFFKSTNSHEKSSHKLDVHGLMPDDIFKSRTLDKHAWHTFEWYSRFYARCAKNFALDALALAGVYIAGGIAAKNLPLFKQKCFMEEFINCAKHRELLEHIPVYVITDYNVSLYGAVYFLLLENFCKA